MIGHISRTSSVSEPTYYWPMHENGEKPIIYHTIIEPHGRGVPEAILNDHSPRAGLPECGRSPHEGRPARGEWSLSMAEGTPSREVLFLLHPYSL